MINEITIPYNFKPRNYQLPLLKAIDNGIKRAISIWHRRAGKDKTLINLIVKKAIEKKGIYYYFFPTYTQAKKIIWDGIDKDGFAFLDHFPKEIIKSKNSQELKIELINGSVFQLVGTDNYDSVRGTNPVGCIFSEFAFQNPMAWEVVRPILTENEGWAIFNTTPNGKNHAYDMYIMARDNKNWFCEILTVRNTQAINIDFINQERISGMSEEMIQQEYFCSFDIGAIGSYYSNQIQQIRDEERISNLPFNKDISIDISFDLGINDMSALWFIQQEGEFYKAINHYESSNKTLIYYSEYIKEYLDEKKAKLGKIILPHDAKKRDLVTGETSQQFFIKEFGNDHVQLVEIGSIEIGIQKLRSMLPKFKFDKDNCKQGILALENYHREYDEVKKVFKDKPCHDWSSHSCDSLRTYAMAEKKFIKDKEKKKLNKIKITNYYNDLENKILS